jgi:LytR cell envelope-related transcriptional attenuator
MTRNDRGAVFPSPVVMLSIIAVVMAGIAFAATRGDEPTERKVSTASQNQEPEDEPTKAPPTKEPKKPKKPAFERGETYVVVFNNSGISGLAGRVAGDATDAGWNVVGSDNWYGTIPANTVYYPQPLKAAAEQLALDLGIERTAPAVDPMQLDRLTVILTGEL